MVDQHRDRGHNGEQSMESAQQDAEMRDLELSVVMPCLNEALTVGNCVQQARGCLDRLGVVGEVIVADNGSTDGSQEIAEESGARVVIIQQRGYGSALRGGIEAARGRFVMMGDADESYDFSGLEPFLQKLREGRDLVMGNRFRGGILPGAMPWHHRYLGNPVLTGILNLFFRSPIKDAHCGLRGFSKSAYEKMQLRTTGMEFASEMVVRACLLNMKISEVPTTLSPDGRDHPPHLRSFRDGWRHLRFLLLYSPRWLYLLPSTVLMAFGAALLVWLYGGQRIVAGVGFDVHTMILGALSLILGFQVFCTGVFAKVFGWTSGLLPPGDSYWLRLFKRFNLERGILIGLALCGVGLALNLWLVWQWQHQSFGPLDMVKTLRPAIVGMTLIVLGAQTLFASFFLSVLRIDRR